MITEGTIYANLVAYRGEFLGVAFDSLARGISVGLGSWVPSGVLGVGVSTGLLGSGTVVGSVSNTVDPYGFYLAGLSGVGISGPLSISFAGVLSRALSESFRGVVYTGVVGVGSGEDVSYFSGDSTLEGYLASGLASSGVVGVMSSSLARGVSVGVRSHIASLVGRGSIAGVPGMTPGSVPSSTRWA